jgi:1-acyl-sn-glycerol-3-phosphate acyltransferase
MLSLFRLLRKIAGWLDLAAFTALMYLVSWLPWRGVHPAARLFHAWCRTFVRAIDVDLRMHQKYREPLPGQFILIANHPGALEDIGIPALFNVVSLAKWEVQDWFIVGRINKAAGTLFVDRENPDSRRQAIEQMVNAVKAGHSVALYPEGGCKGRRLFSEFKSGAFEVSLRTGVPILPIFLHYEAQEDFEWLSPDTLLDKIWHMATSRNRRANYYVFDPLDPKDYADKYTMKAAAYALYVQWDKKYLE